MTKHNNLSVWGYVQTQVPEHVHFVPFDSFCSLESACSYLGADQTVYMNSADSMDTLNPEMLSRLGNRGIICGLTHGQYVESAEKIGLLSKTMPNLVGAIIDDFLDESGNYYKGPSAGMSPDDLAKVHAALKLHNPALKLYVVRYTRQNPERLIPYLPYFDVLNLWVWCSTKDFWISQYHDTIAHLLAMYDKPIMQGIFLHHYGFSNNESPVMDLDLLEIQCERISEELRRGHVDSWCVLQNGWFALPSHRKHVQFLREYFQWHYMTTTVL